MQNSRWTRRKFVGAAAASAALSAAPPASVWALGQEGIPPPSSQKNSAEIISGGLVPLLDSNLARPMRYKVEGGAFTIYNGKEFFNRPLYGPNIPFRVDGGDLPEFSLYLPGHGGNLRLGVANAAGEGKWLHQADGVRASYRSGRLAYTVRDPFFGPFGVVQCEALTDGASLWLEITSQALLPGLWLTWAFAGVSGRKGRRNGDIGCEVEPVSQFFQVRPEECRGNQWTFARSRAKVVSKDIQLQFSAPEGAELRVVEGAAWQGSWRRYWASGDVTPSGELPALAGRVPFTSLPRYVRIEVLSGSPLPALSMNKVPSPQFFRRKAELSVIANAVKWYTPDPHLDAIAQALCIAADAVWDETQGCVMHGAVAWRIALAGWRGPYALDVLGRHDRMQRHLRHWIAKQDVSPITNGASGVPGLRGFSGIVEAKGAPDKGSDHARTEELLHSNGDLSHNHYDMNLVCFDALLRHLRSTGDLAFAREAWPALQRHAAWERRLFRRDFGTEAQPLPLYEAYAAIWASDNLQYNGGGATHSSAYNVFLNREMARLARLLGEDAAVSRAHDAEADAITHAMNTLLWMPERGAFAEGKDWLAPQTLQESPAVWTMYHAIDCELATPKQAWQMAAERLRALRKVPVVGEGVPHPEAAWQLPCSDWLPYEWSLTLLCLGENLHTALALFQAGMAEEAHGLLRGSLLDAAFRGLCPGNFPMSLQMDPHRQESQRDFADPIACASRALLQGLWGVEPDLLSGRLSLRPQLPDAWEHANLQHPELTVSYTRGARDRHDVWTVTPAFRSPPALHLRLKAHGVELPSVLINGRAVQAVFDAEAVGSPVLVLDAPAAAAWKIEITWRGEVPAPAPREPIAGSVGQKIQWPQGTHADLLDDPQGCLRDGSAARAGRHLVFARMEHGACRYWLPLELDIREPGKQPALTHPQPGERFEPFPLTGHLTAQVRDIFTRPHTSPRSGLCSLNLPDGLLGGWANFDVTARIDDRGLRAAGGDLPIMNDLRFLTPANPQEPNCCFLSHWESDRSRLNLPLTGRAHAAYLLLACTTFPQATRSLHGAVQVHYRDAGPATSVELRSPSNWWPVEQDYLVDDYIFRLEPVGAPEEPLPIRVDLATGKVRVLDRVTLKGKRGAIAGGSATVLRVALDPQRDLAQLELSCEMYGVQFGLLAVTLGR